MLAGVVKGLVSRFLPQPNNDGEEVEVRLNRYGELIMQPSARKQHSLAEDGSYFTCNNAQAGLATAAAPTAFSATNPFLLIANTDNPGSNARSIYLDYLMLLATAAGTAGASLQVAVTIDQGNRYTSGGSELTANIVNCSMLSAQRTSVARVFAGNITAAGAGSNVRTHVGNRYMKGAIPVAGDEYTINFGGIEAMNNISISTIMKSVFNAPPLIIGPQQCALVHIWLPSQSGASSYAPELSWWER